MDVRTVFFDLDDTLFDHRHARLAALRAIRTRVPKLALLPVARLDRSYERLLAEVHRTQVLPGRLSLEESRVLRMTRFLLEFGIELPPSTIGDLLAYRQAVYRRNRRAVPGALALLSRLRSLYTAIAVVTNNLRSEQEEKLRVTGLDAWVDELVCSEQVGFTKPDRRIFTAALARTRSTPARSVMVGDSWESDVMGALAARIRPIWFHRDATPNPQPTRAAELRSFRPLSHATSVILDHRGK